MSKQTEKAKKERRAEREADKQAKEKRTALITGIVASVLLLALVALIVVTAVNCGKIKDDPDYTPATTHIDENTKYVEMKIKGISTPIIIRLDGTSAPITVANFVKLVNEGFYDGLTFHRVMENFMIQGGDPKADGTGGSKDTIKGEFSENGWTENKIAHARGVISMARATGMDTASSQFFLCNGDSASTKALDGKYAAFGVVVSGIGVVDRITEKSLPSVVGSNGMIPDKSNQMVIKSVRVLENYHE